MRFFALSLPFISLSCALSGFFTAERLSGVYAGVQLAEQIAKILFSMLILLAVGAESAVGCCLAVILSQCVSSAANTLVSFLLYRRFRRGKTGRGAPKMRDLLKIALPDSVSSCLRSALVTVRQLFIPRAFSQSGISAAEGIATFGIIQSMALPVVYFASCISSSFSSLLIPEIADCIAKGDKKKADTEAVKALKLTFIYALLVSAAVWLSAPLVADRLFPGKNADFYIRLLSPIIPISYMDTTTDCILKGLGLQLDSMRFNIIEAAVCLAMVLTLVPRFGIWGYLLMIFTGEILNFALSISRLAFCLSSSPRGGDKEHDDGVKLKSAHKHIECQKKLHWVGKDRKVARGADE
jgi:stage V sporulation protein B